LDCPLLAGPPVLPSGGENPPEFPVPAEPGAFNPELPPPPDPPGCPTKSKSPAAPPPDAVLVEKLELDPLVGVIPKGPPDPPPPTAIGKPVAVTTMDPAPSKGDAV
jgi:hypothetical protein